MAVAFDTFAFSLIVVGTVAHGADAALPVMILAGLALVTLGLFSVSLERVMVRETKSPAAAIALSISTSFSRLISKSSVALMFWRSDSLNCEERIRPPAAVVEAAMALRASETFVTTSCAVLVSRGATAVADTSETVNPRLAVVVFC